MTVKFEMRHTFRCNEETFWGKVFFDEEYNRRLFEEGLDFAVYEPLELQEEANGDKVRRVKTQPKVQMPAAVQKLLGEPVSIEEGRFEAASKVWKFKLIPAKMADKIHISGEIRISPTAGGIERRASFEIKADIFGVGGLIEGFVEKQLRENYDKGAVFTNRYLQEKGMIAGLPDLSRGRIGSLAPYTEGGATVRGPIVHRLQTFSREGSSMKLQQGRSREQGWLPWAVRGLLGMLAVSGVVACAPASEEKTNTGGSDGSTSAGAGGTAAGSGGAAGSGAGAAGEAGNGGAGAGGTAGAAGNGGAAGSTAGNGGSGGGDSLEVGKDCSGSTECPGGTCLDPTTFPGGYCSKVCSGDVISQGDPCPQGAVCVQIVQAAAVCLDACNSKSDCRPGYACRPIPDTNDKVCFPACQSDADCGSLEACDTTDGLCKPDATKKGKPGDPCSANDQCLGNGNYCFTNEAYPGGMCSAACNEANVKQECPGLSGSNCFAADFGAGIEYTCFGKCKTSVDCRDGYVCSADAGENFQANDKTGACVPTCKNFPCGDGYVCDPTGICVADKQGVAFQVTKQDLGKVSVSSNNFQTVSFNLPENTLSFTLVATPSKPVDAVVPVTVTTPAGVVYDYFDPLKTQYKTFGLSNVPYAGLYPNTPKLSMPAGTYSFEMGATDPVDLQIDVLFKQGSGILSAGTMPMVFFFTEGNSFNAASAKADPVFQQAVNKVKQAYAQINITLTVNDSSYIDLPASSQYAVIDERSELAGLFALANNYDISGLNFFFIDQYTFQGGSGVLGISGGIPGSPGLQGVTHAGVSVAYGLLKDDAETLGIVMAHEGGHYLGLYHPTEATGQAFDPLDDTPECPASKFDKNGDGRVDHVECASAGTSNVMFWLVNGPPNKTFTTDQQFVLMRNPLVSH